MKTPLTRRVVAALALSALMLSSCGGASPVASANDAFMVNGTSFALDDFETLLADLVASQQMDEVRNGQPSKEDAINVMRTLIRYEAYRQYIGRYGLEESSADRQKVENDAEGDEQFGSLPEYMKDLLINLSVAQVTISKFKAHSSSTLKTLYNESPASTGVMCLSHILLQTEDEANAALKELANGAKFADVARKRSIEPGARTTGGALANDEEPCADISFFQRQLDSDFMLGAVGAKAGVPTGPVKTQFGFHIILNLAYDDIKSSLEKVAAEQPSSSNLAGFVATSDISVNSRFGSWNSGTSDIK